YLLLGSQKRSAFFVGSRYGRSSASTTSGTTSFSSRRLIIVPRNDQFFLGSRYGKRSSEFLAPYEQINFSLALSKRTRRKEEKQISYLRIRFVPLLKQCIYAGIKNYYHCVASQ
ncbi:RYamide neuropeptides, partial [Drosophila suzukii]|uniref:RYamide neuropeptides n=1 Tax=Drosophila suzukii TaxID=28584 RepID=A0ABM4TYK1_DROSZ